MEIKDIIELMKAVSDNGLTKFELEDGDTKLVMKREKQVVTVSGMNPGAGIGGFGGHATEQNAVSMHIPMYSGDSMVYTQMHSAAMSGAGMGIGVSQPGEHPKSETEVAETGNVIKCPLVGTFYSSPSPDAECFVKVGDHVKKGQVVGIVEAMKLMNEIESEFDGVVEAVLVNNESTVEYGQPLFRIR